MKPFAVYSILKYLQRTVKKVSKKNLPMIIQHGVYMIKFAHICNFLKICEKNSPSFLRTCVREKLLI